MTQEPYAPPAELKLAREYGTTRGILDGQRDALDRVEVEAYLDAYHSQLRAAGLCRCEEIAAAPASPAPVAAHPSVDLKALADQLSGFVVELSRIAATLQPKLLPRGERVQPVHAPELAREADEILAQAVVVEPAFVEVLQAPVDELAAGGIVSPPGPAPDWAPHCQYGCDNEAPYPGCALHGDAAPIDTPFLPRLATGGLVKPRAYTSEAVRESQ